ncbi:MAG: DUF2236 domain-containing protein [Acidobacteria bacterium]|nr:DUF2236 domain-containing protein [Acidobacteriota bacterium]
MPLLISKRVNAERLAVLGWSRAILLQVAHPLVAAGVAEHSTFRRGSVTAVARLHHTIRAMLALTFGDAAARQAAVGGIRAIHRRVHGQLPVAAGMFPAGTPYSAEDPALVLWVHATLLESIPLIYEATVAPLEAGERDAYCAEAAEVAIDLGARAEEVPRTWAATLEYLARTYASGAIAVSEQARELAAAVLAPPFAWVVGPLARANRLVTVGLLPPPLRAQYGLDWDDRREAQLARTLRRLRRLRRALPRRLAWWPEARLISSPP